MIHRLTEWDVSLSDLLELHAHGFDFARGEEASSQTEICQFDMTSRVDQEVLGLEISMDVPKLVKCIDGAEHLSNVEAGMSVCKDASVVEKGSEVSPRDVFLFMLALS